MKCLKLENKGDGLRYGRVFIGSLCESSYNKGLLKAIGAKFEIIGASENYFYISCEKDKEIMTPKEILIPLDSLKLCPFVAMREGIRVKLKTHVGIEICGKIRAGESTGDGTGYGCFYIWEDGCSGNTVKGSPEQITLDLHPIERGEIDGVSVVEV